MIFLLKFSDWYIKAQVIFMDCVDMAFEAATTSERTIAFRTRDHGVGQRRFESKSPAPAEGDAPAFVEMQRKVGVTGKVPGG